MSNWNWITAMKSIWNYVGNDEMFESQLRLILVWSRLFPEINCNQLFGAVQDLFKASGKIWDNSRQIFPFLSEPMLRLFPSTSLTSLWTFFQTFLRLKYVLNNFTTSQSRLKFVLQLLLGSTSFFCRVLKKKNILYCIIYIQSRFPKFEQLKNLTKFYLT